MRVTHVITRLIIGGAQENTVDTVLGLRQYPGLQVHLVAGPGSGPEGSLEPAFAAAPELLTVLPSLVRPIHPWCDLLAWLRLVGLPGDSVHIELQFRPRGSRIVGPEESDLAGKTRANRPVFVGDFGGH